MDSGASLTEVSEAELAASPRSVRRLLVAMAGRIADLEARVAVLEKENAALRAESASLRAENASLRAENASLRAENASLRAENALLREKLGLNSSNSGKPPSSDGPAAKPPPPAKRSKNKRGGQPGHPRHRRQLLPLEEVNRVDDLRPDHCGRCGETLEGDDPEPLRHQVVELAQVLRHVHEYRLHLLTCPSCAAKTLATLPQGVPTGAFGPRLLALVALMSGRYRISKRAINEMLLEVFEIEMSLGAVCNSEQQLSEAIEGPAAEAKAHVQAQPVVHVDETSWREAKQRAWLWVMATLSVTVFRIDRHRSAAAAQALMGEQFAGIAVTDRYSGYSWLPDGQRQSCWAHLARDWQRLIDRGGPSAEIGRRLATETKKLFRWWHRVRDGTRDRVWFQAKMKRVRRAVHRALEQGLACSHDKTAGMCNEILLLEDTLWTFVDVEGVEPTNNLGERQVRPGVIWRKTSFGTDSPKGSRFVERILTVVMSLRSQGRKILDFLVQSLRAWSQGTSMPSLLPAQAALQPTCP